MDLKNNDKLLRAQEDSFTLKKLIENRFLLKLPSLLWKFSQNKDWTLFLCSTINFVENVKSTKTVILSEDSSANIKITLLLNSKVVNIPFIAKIISNIDELSMVLKVVDSLKICKSYFLNKAGTCSLYSLEFDVCRSCKNLNLEPAVAVVNTNLLVFDSLNLNGKNAVNDIRCSFCNKSVTNLTNLVRHERSHLPNCGERFKCDICTVPLFKESNALVEHYRELHGNVQFIKCTMCEEKFTKSKYLQMHIRLHQNSMKYFCQNCGAEFLNNNVFQNHICKIVKEEERKPKFYICSICNCKFTTNHLLIQHQREHQISFPLKCYLCKRSFLVKSELIEHKKHCKLKRLGHVCNVCNKRFSCVSQKISHVNTVHSKKGIMNF